VDYASVLFDLGSALTKMDRLDEAEPPLREALKLRQGLGDLPATLSTMEGLAQLVWRRDTRESERIYAEELALARKAYQPSHAKLSWILRNYAYTVRQNRGPAAAEPLQREALEIARAAYGGAHWEVGQCLQHLAVTLRQLQRSDEARALLGEECEMYRKLFGPENERTLKAVKLLEEEPGAGKQ
jgi:tetratricopeptide (TPR) repeat protein